MSDEEILAVFHDSDDPALFAKEVAESVDYTRQGITNRLDDLVREGELVKKKSGKRSAVYWPPSAESSIESR